MASTMVLTLSRLLCTDEKDGAAWYASSIKRLVKDQALSFCLDGTGKDGRRRIDWQDWCCAIFGKIELKTRRHSPICVHNDGSSGCLFFA